MRIWLTVLVLCAATADPAKTKPTDTVPEPAILKEHFQVLQRDAANRSSCAILLPARIPSTTPLLIQVDSASGNFRHAARRIELSGRIRAVLVENLAVGGPYTIRVCDDGRATKALLEFHDVFVGDIWLLGGQSNMFGIDIVRERLPPIPGINMFDLRHFDRDAHWCAAVPPIHRIPDQFAPFTLKSQHPEYTDATIREIIANKTPVGGIDSSYFFARRLYAETKIPIGLIPCATGGSLSIWDPAKREQNRYGFLMHHIQGVGGRVKGLLFFQGEQDAIFGDEHETVTKPSLIGPVSTYGDRFVTFIEALRKDVHDPDMPVIFAQICRHHNGPTGRGRFWEMVREAQRRVPERLSNTHCVPTLDLDLIDGLHLDYDSHRKNGERMADLALQYVKPDTPKKTEIRLKSATFRAKPKPAIVVKFSGVTGRLRASGRPTGFVLKHQSTGESVDWIYKTDFDAADPSTVVLRTTGGPTADLVLYYGTGPAPYVNLVDEADMPVPAFGPVTVKNSENGG